MMTYDTTTSEQPSPPPAPRRLFCAVTFDDETRAVLASAQAALAPRLRSGRPSSAENLHLTLDFLGGCTPEQERAAALALDAACAEATPFDLVLTGVGSFGKRGGSVVWAGVGEGPGTDALVELQRTLTRELVTRGFELRDGYTPHVTLFRAARPRPPATLGEVCDAAAATLGARTLHVSEAHLMWSHHPAGAGLTYTSIHRATFGRV